MIRSKRGYNRWMQDAIKADDRYINIMIRHLDSTQLKLFSRYLFFGSQHNLFFLIERVIKVWRSKFSRLYIDGVSKALLFLSKKGKKAIFSARRAYAFNH